MKKIMVIFMLLLMSFSLVGCDFFQAEEIGVMDMQLILAQSQRAQELQAELLDIGNQLEKLYEEKEEELSGEEEETELNRIYQEYLDNKQRLEEELNQEIIRILTEIVEEKNIAVVISKDEAYYGGLDITQEVIARLDEEAKGGEE